MKSMSNVAVVANVALEMWRASGLRTIERLNALLNDYANVYCLAGESRSEAFAMAQSKVHSWEVK